MSGNDRDLIGLAAERGLLNEAEVRAALGDETVSIDKLVARGYVSAADAEALRRATAPTPEGDRVGRYIKVREIGHGGFGAVWLAWDPQLSRHVAVKLLRATDVDDLARFRREASLAAGLSHPNIAAVYEVSEDPPFIAMQYIEGHDADEAKLTLTEALRVIQEAAEAVQAAHEKGIIHRDLKPQNVRIDTGGRVYVMDFGLAKRHDTESTLSQSGAILGTPAFMSPEQAEGHVNLDARADVYGLGATLYALISGSPPFQGAALEVLRQVIEVEPAPLKVNPDVQTIVGKAMEKDPARRFRSARDLADEIGRFLAGDPILARPASLAYRLKRRVRRNPWAWGMGAAAAVMLAVASVAAAVMLKRARTFELSQQASESIREAELALTKWRAERYYPRHDVTGPRREVRKAMERITAALAIQPEAHPAIAMLGWAHLELNEPQAAVDALGRAIALDGGDGRYHWWLGRAHRRIAQDLRKEADVTAIADAKGRLLERADAIDRLALAAYRSALQLPWRADAWERALAEAYVAFFDRQDDRALREVARRTPQGGEEALVELGLAAAGAGRFPQARADFKGAATLAPSYSTAYAALARVQLTEANFLAQTGGDGARIEALFGDALDDADRAVGVDPEASDGWDIRGTTHLSRAGFLSGTGREAKEEYEGALTNYSKAIELQPKNGTYRVHRAAARVNWAGHGHDDAVALLRTSIEGDLTDAVELMPGDVYPLACRGQARVNLAKIMHDRGENPTPVLAAAIEEDFGRALAAAPGSADALRRRGQARTNLGYYVYQTGGDPTAIYRAAVEEDLRPSAEGLPEYYESWLRLSQALENWGVYLRHDGEDPMATFTEAERCATRSIDCNARVAEAWFERGRIRFSMAVFLAEQREDAVGVFESSIVDFTRALEENPAWYAVGESRAMVRIHLLNESVRLGEDPLPHYGPIVEDLTIGLKGSPRNASLLMQRGEAHLQWGRVLDARGEDPTERLEAAIGDLSASLALDPGDPMLMEKRGEARTTLGRRRLVSRKDAEPFFRAAVEEDFGPLAEANPESYDAWVRLGGARADWATSRMQKGEDPGEQFRAAIERDLERAIELNADGIDAWRHRGTARMNWALHLDKAGGDATRQLELAATEDFQSVVEIRAEDVDGWRRGGEAAGAWGAHLDLAGKPGEAITAYRRAEEWLTRAIELDAGADAYRRRGMARSRVGKPAEALADLEEAVKLNPALKAALRGLMEELRRRAAGTDF